MQNKNSYIKSNWPAPDNVQAWVSTRQGGHSVGAYSGLNFSKNVGDDPQRVDDNRQQLCQDLALPNPPRWIHLVHGVKVDDVRDVSDGSELDGLWSDSTQQVLLIQTADCLPVLFCDRKGAEIAAVHAGWRSLAGGILENALQKFSAPVEDIMVWFGPAISQPAFEVGEEVRQQFIESYPEAGVAFEQGKCDSKWQADLYELARIALKGAGISSIYGGDYCTYSDQRFYSYRRDGAKSGRIASLVWLK